MKKLITMCAMVAMLMGSTSWAATWNINPGDSIQAAVDSAASDDTIFVNAGTYTEQVTLAAGKNLTFIGAGRNIVTWIAPGGGSCLTGDMSAYSGTMNYHISGFTFNARNDASTEYGAGIGIFNASTGPLSLSIHDNRFVEDRASGDNDHWATSMFLCHNRYAARDGSGTGTVRVYNNIDETWGGLTMSNSQAYDITNNIFDGCSDAIYNGHGCPDTAGQTFGNHLISGNIFKNASDELHTGLTPAIDWQYYGGGGGTHLASTIEENLFYSNDTAVRFIMDTDMTYPGHILTNNNFIGNDMAVSVGGGYPSLLNAQGNWWNAIDGPGPVGPGSGDPITTYVDYGSFATAPIDGVPVPEPATMCMLALGGLTLIRRKRKA